MFKTIQQSISRIEKAENSKKNNEYHVKLQDSKLKQINDIRIKFQSHVEYDTQMIESSRRMLRAQYESMSTKEKIRLFEKGNSEYMRDYHDKIRELLNLEPVVRGVAASEEGDPSTASESGAQAS
jgi:hypothetical protein